MTTLARYAIYSVIGMLLGAAGLTVIDWQWWGWFLTIMAAIVARDWANEERRKEAK